MTLNIWPYEVKTACDSCRDEFEPGELWHLFKGESRADGDIVCISCIPADAWAAWHREGRATQAENVMGWLLEGSPECVAAANETIAQIRERDELDEMRRRLVEENLDGREFDNPAVERAARDSAAGTYRIWTREQLEAEVAKLPTPRRCPACDGRGLDERDEPCRRCLEHPGWDE